VIGTGGPTALAGPAGPVARVGEPLLAASLVAASLIAVVYAVDPVERAVRAAPWAMGPALWVMTTVGAGAVLRRLPGRAYPARALVVAALAGGALDALVVAAGHPWPGLVCGITAFAVVTAALRARGARGGPRRGSGTPPPRAGGSRTR
jgi:hypothetical protein